MIILITVICGILFILANVYLFLIFWGAFQRIVKDNFAKILSVIVCVATDLLILCLVIYNI